MVYISEVHISEEEERGRIQELINEFDADGSGEIEFEEFHQMVARTREILCMKLLKEQQRIIDEEQIPHSTLAHFSSVSGEIVTIYNTFYRYLQNFGSRCIVVNKDWIKAGCKEIFAVLCDGGFPFHCKPHQMAVFSLFRFFRLWTQQVMDLLKQMFGYKETDAVSTAYYFGFASYLNLVIEIRKEIATQNHDELWKLFKRYDVDGDQELQMPEISKLLDWCNCLPRSHDEQKEIVCMLDEIDEDGSGTINFEEFKNLTLKIKEKQLVAQRLKERECALTHGISEMELFKQREAFYTPLPGESNSELLGDRQLDFNGVRKLFRKFGFIHIPLETIEELFDEVDDDKSGFIEFTEYLYLYKIINDPKYQRPGTYQGQGSHQAHGGQLGLSNSPAMGVGEEKGLGGHADRASVHTIKWA